MATVRVRALSRVHGLRYGDEATIEHTPMVDLLLEAGKLAVIVDQPAAAPAQREAHAATEFESTIVDDDQQPTAESESTDAEPVAAEAPRRSKRGRPAKESPDDEVT